jgi:hypothetical protein
LMSSSRLAAAPIRTPPIKALVGVKFSMLIRWLPVAGQAVRATASG